MEHHASSQRAASVKRLPAVDGVENSMMVMVEELRLNPQPMINQMVRQMLWAHQQHQDLNFSEFRRDMNAAQFYKALERLKTQVRQATWCDSKKDDFFFVLSLYERLQMIVMSDIYDLSVSEITEIIQGYFFDGIQLLSRALYDIKHQGYFETPAHIH
jgi:hypothetical protein